MTRPHRFTASPFDAPPAVEPCAALSPTASHSAPTLAGGGLTPIAYRSLPHAMALITASAFSAAWTVEREICRIAAEIERELAAEAQS